MDNSCQNIEQEKIIIIGGKQIKYIGSEQIMEIIADIFENTPKKDYLCKK